MSSDELLEDVFPNVLRRAPSPASLGSTPLEFSGVEGENLPAACPQVAVITEDGYHCPECGNILQTKSGFTRHMTAHKINGYKFRKPEEDEIRSTLPNIFQEVLNEISSEPAIGEMGAQKRKFIEAVSSADFNSTSTTLFLNSVSAPLIEIALKKGKIMPSAQYEEMLSKVNYLISDGTFFISLKDKLLACVPEETRHISSAVLERLLWRIVTKLSLQIQKVIFQKMKKNHEAAHVDFSMSDQEISVYKDHVGQILRNVYRFGHKTENDIWKLRCQSLRERFVVSETCAVRSAEFIDKNLWKDMSISLSDPCFNLFLGLEKVIQGFQNNASACTAQTVFDSVTNPENIIILSELRQLTHGILSEDVALTFLRELIKIVVAHSARWDAKRKREIASIKQKTANVATRSDLKRNPKQGSEPPISTLIQSGAAASSSNQRTGHKKSARSKRTPSPASSSVLGKQASGSRANPKKGTPKKTTQKSSESKRPSKEATPRKATPKKATPSEGPARKARAGTAAARKATNPLSPRVQGEATGSKSGLSLPHTSREGILPPPPRVQGEKASGSKDQPENSKRRKPNVSPEVDPTSAATRKSTRTRKPAQK